MVGFYHGHNVNYAYMLIMLVILIVLLYAHYVSYINCTFLSC